MPRSSRSASLPRLASIRKFATPSPLHAPARTNMRDRTNRRSNGEPAALKIQTQAINLVRPKQVLEILVHILLKPRQRAKLGMQHHQLIRRGGPGRCAHLAAAHRPFQPQNLRRVVILLFVIGQTVNVSNAGVSCSRQFSSCWTAMRTARS